jgi:hypothetical protein
VRKLLIVIVACLLVSSLFAQVSDKIIKVNVGIARPSQPLTIQVDLFQSNILDRIEIAFRQFGERDFRRIEMSLSGNSASITLPAEIVLSPFIEYYFILTVSGSSIPETYPIENPEQQPFRVSLLETPVQPYEFVLLSPDKDEMLSPNDVLISFSVVQYDSSIDMRAVKIFLDDIDLSKIAVRSGNLIVVKPENASVFPEGGSHLIRVDLFDKDGKIVETFTQNFLVSGAAEKKSIGTSSPWLYNASIQLETRQEYIDRTTTPFNRATISANGNYNEFRVIGNLYLTNEEKKNLQPQNRYFIGAESPWVKIGFGDSYPIFPDLIMNGKRIRGFIGNLNLGKLNVDIATGSIRRHIESIVGTPFSDSNLVTEQGANSSNATFVLYDSTASGKRWVKVNPGTFDRRLFAIRTIFGGRNESHIGFTYLKSSDDKNSIRYGHSPMENVVLGSDLLLTFDRRNIEISGQLAFSATNKDISNGSFTNEDINRVFPESTYSKSDRDAIHTIRDIFSRIITVNEHLVPLAMKNFPTLSYEGGVSLNYFNNNFKLNYLRHGSSFESFGQLFLRTDVVGYNISDRQRIIGNQVFLSGGYERLQDNTAKIKATTTTSATTNIGVSYYPRINFPNISVAYLLNTNSNDPLINDTLSAISDNTNRVLIQIGKEFIAGARHNAILSVSTSLKNDRTVRDLDTRNTAVTLSAISTFNIPLQTVVSLTVNSNKFISGKVGTPGTSANLSYTTLYTSGQCRLLADKLILNSSFSPTFGDIQRVLVNAGAQYFFWNNISAQTQLNIYFNRKMYFISNTNTDVIWNLILRAAI